MIQPRSSDVSCDSPKCRGGNSAHGRRRAQHGPAIITTPAHPVPCLGRAADVTGSSIQVAREDRLTAAPLFAVLIGPSATCLVPSDFGWSRFRLGLAVHAVV